MSDEFLEKTDFQKNQYGLLRELYQNETFINTFTDKELKLFLTTPEQELIGIYDESYIRQYGDYFKPYDLKAHPKGFFNPYELLYKTLDGEYIVEIQYS